MRMRQDGQQFKNPDNVSDSDDQLDELVEEVDEFGDPLVIAAGHESDSASDDGGAPEPDGDADGDGDFVPAQADDASNVDSDSSDYVELDPDDSMNDTDDDDDDDEEEEEEHAAGASSGPTKKTTPSQRAAEAAQTSKGGGGGDGGGGGGGPSCSTVNSSLPEMDDEEDETVRAMIAAIKKPRTTPPEIKLDDFITDICFHPEEDIIALGTITGDVSLYKFHNDGNTHLRTIEVHAKATRDVQFTDDGRNLLTCSKDKSIMVTDMQSEKLKKFYESAHEEAINKLHVLDANLFATGDDGGTVKLWDLRTKHAIFALKEVEDYISQLLTNDDKKLLLFTSGDGHLTTINIGARKLYVQSEPYEEELTCMGIYRGDSKLVAGTSKGRLYTFNWGQFGYHCDMFPGLKSPISEMIPITDRIGCVAGEEGVIRACHIAPFRNLGIVGQHSMPVESLDISSAGDLIASSSHNNDVRFWNVKYFEDFGDIKYNEKHNSHREKSHNLPSSRFANAGDFFADLAKAPTDHDHDHDDDD